MFIKNNVKYYIGDCINFLTKNYGRVIGEILEVGYDTFGGDYIYIKSNHKDSRITIYTSQLF